MNQSTSNAKNIIKIFQILRNKIKNIIIIYGNISTLGQEPSEDSKHVWK